MPNEFIKASFWRTALLALACAALAGCATDVTLERPREAGEIGFQPGQGVVILDVASNGDVSRLVDKWNRLAVKNVATGQIYIVQSSEPRYLSRSLFVGALPEGTYTLEELRDWRGTGVGNVWSSGKLGAELGRFRIESGRVTNLGIMAYLQQSLFYGKPEFWIEFLPATAEFQRTFDQLEPGVAQSARTAPLSWLPPAENERRPQWSRRFIGRSFHLNSPFPTKDGSIYFGEALGQVAHRDKSGKWTWLQTGAASPILSVTVLDNGVILAGSEQGFLFLKEANSSRWKTIPFPRPQASIRFIGALPGVGYVAVAHDKENIFVLGTPSLEKPVWKEMNRVPNELTLLSASANPFRAWVHDGRLTVARRSPLTFSPRRMEFHEFNAKEGRWKTNEVTLSIIHQDAFTVLPDGSLYTFSGPPLSQNAFASRDGGATWEERASPNWLDIPAFRSKVEGYALHQDKTPLTDPLNTEHSVWKTTDGGFKWELLNKTPNRAYKLILLETPGHMIVAAQDKRLYFSSDWGATWRLEYWM